MQIIIDIPESEIPKQQDVIEIPLHFIDGEVCEAGRYEFDVLPKGHGRLIDVDKLLDENIDTFMMQTETKIRIAPTVIEGDKENEK